MHIEIQVALNFVISYLYNKLPRRRVNIFGEELEKALKDKFQGHWYPEKPFKGSAFRCLKTGDPIDSVLERAARESGVPISDILENLPNELSVWVDPGEVSYRVGEKGAVKILYSENNDNQEDSSSADVEVNKTFNPEAQCFRPIDVVNTSMNSLSLSPKTSPMAGSSPLSASSNSPTYKGSPNPVAANGINSNSVSFMQRSQAPLTFTTATFAQTKFGSTKLKTNSKRSNNTSYRMSPTEFSNYIKQRAMQQQQMHHGHGHSPNGTSGPTQPGNHFGPIGPVSPARSLSPNPLSLGFGQNGGDSFYFPNMAMGIYPQFNSHHRNIFDTHFHGAADSNGLFTPANNGSSGGHSSKFNNYLEPHGFYGMTGNHHMQQQQSPSPIVMSGSTVGGASLAVGNMKTTNETVTQNSKDSSGIHNISNTANSNNSNNNNNAANITVTVTNGSGGESTSVSPVPPTMAVGNNAERQNAANAVAAVAAVAAAATASTVNNSNSQDSSDSSNGANNSKLIDGLNSFYSNNTGSYQQLLVAN